MNPQGALRAVEVAVGVTREDIFALCGMGNSSESSHRVHVADQLSHPTSEVSGAVSAMGSLAETQIPPAVSAVHSGPGGSDSHWAADSPRGQGGTTLGTSMPGDNGPPDNVVPDGTSVTRLNDSPTAVAPVVGGSAAAPGQGIDPVAGEPTDAGGTVEAGGSALVLNHQEQAMGCQSDVKHLPTSTDAGQVPIPTDQQAQQKDLSPQVSHPTRGVPPDEAKMNVDQRDLFRASPCRIVDLPDATTSSQARSRCGRSIKPLLIGFPNPSLKLICHVSSDSQFNSTVLMCLEFSLRV